MTAITRPTERISPEDYLKGERQSEVRHEYVDGCVWAMAGASADHNRIVANLLAALHSTLRGEPCETFVNDMKVKIPPGFADAFYYPDVMIACDPADDAKYYRERPSVIFEVISPDTERTDRREKAIAYRQISAMEVYAPVEQDRMAVTVLRQADTGWESELLEGPNAVIALPGIGLELPLKQIFERTAAAGAPPPQGSPD